MNIFKIKKHIQRLVETPELYMIGQCANNDEQLGYIETCVACLKGLKNGINLSELDQSCENVVLNDTMCFFHGDGPATALEAGNQKRGNYFCPSCDVHLCLTDDIAHCYRQKVRSLGEKQYKLLQGTLSVSQLKAELRSRNVELTNLKSTKKDLVPELKKVLLGIKRVPILLHNPHKNLNQMGLARYEIVMVECMHDIANHIDNILEQLPNHLKGDDKEKFTEMIETHKAEKEKKRCCDKCKILLQLTQNLHYEIDGCVHRLLRSLSEIQRILYLGDDFYELLKKFYCTTFVFVILKKIISIGITSKMTRDNCMSKINTVVGYQIPSTFCNCYYIDLPSLNVS